MRIVLVAFFFALLPVTQLHGTDHAAILLYHHVGDDSPARTTVSPAIFRRHLDYLDVQGFHVLPLSSILQILAAGGSVPDRTVSITFDDAYRSVLETALPLLREKKYPFTVFVSTEAVDRRYSNYLGWDELRQLQEGGAEVGNHSRHHDHLIRRRDGESDQQWQTRIIEDILYAGQRLYDELGGDNNMFAYPYGEHTPALQEIVGSLGYFGIAQQSGSVGVGMNLLAVPRFPMATDYSGERRFIHSVHARPLPVTGVSVGPAILKAGTASRQTLVFYLLPGGYRASELSCYDSSGQRLAVMKEEGEKGLRISVPLPDWGAGRRKINCTAPSSEKNGVYYWYSHLWLVTRLDGQWYEE